VNVTRAVRSTLLATFAASVTAIVAVLLYVDPWGVPRIVAGVLIGSFVVAIAAGKLLQRRCAVRTNEGDDTFVVAPGPVASPLSRAPVPQSSAAPLPGH
jgi:hypothetical protein